MTNTADQQHCLRNMDEIPPYIFISENACLELYPKNLNSQNKVWVWCESNFEVFPLISKKEFFSLWAAELLAAHLC